jgi:hypothetical protein
MLESLRLICDSAVELYNRREETTKLSTLIGSSTPEEVNELAYKLVDDLARVVMTETDLDLRGGAMKVLIKMEKSKVFLFSFFFFSFFFFFFFFFFSFFFFVHPVEKGNFPSDCFEAVAYLFGACSGRGG